MGHRASVCYWNGSVGTVHYSHWGAYNAELLDKITRDSPFGEGNMEPEFVNEFLSSLQNETEEIEVGGYLTEAQSDTPVDQEPKTTVDSLQEWAESMNALMRECAYLVDVSGDEWTVRAFAPIYWDGVEHDRLGDSGYVLIEMGEQSHDCWGGSTAETWNDFIEAAENYCGKKADFVVEP